MISQDDLINGLERHIVKPIIVQKFSDIRWKDHIKTSETQYDSIIDRSTGTVAHPKIWTHTIPFNECIQNFEGNNPSVQVYLKAIL